jgi:hypothetical protein
VHAVRRTGGPRPSSNYELFNLNNFNIRYWSWNYRGCWPARPPRIGPLRLAWQALLAAVPLSRGLARPSSGLGGGSGQETPRPEPPTPFRALHGRARDRSRAAPLGISIGTEPVASPDPGCVAGTHLPLRRVLD